MVTAVDGITLAVECVGTKHSGGATVLRDLLSVLVRDPRFTRIVVYTTPREARAFDLPPSEKVEERPRSREERSYAMRIHWYLRRLQRTCRRDGVGVLLCANGMGLSGGIPRVALVQQALPYSAEALARLSLGRRLRMAVIRQLTCLSLRSATEVVAQSRAMAETLRTRCRLGARSIVVCRPTVSAFPAGGGKAVREAMATYPADRRLLYVGGSAPHKNLDLVARAMARLREKVPGATLFITCPAKEPFSTLSGVVPLGYLGPPELGAAYAEATAVVQPSLVESGPLVPQEAMEAGRPLLVADRPWAREVCGTGALYFNPGSEEEFVGQAERLLTCHDLRATLVQAGKRRRNEIRKEASYQRLADLLVRAHGAGAATRKGGMHV